jgi:hypothetical protein
VVFIVTSARINGPNRLFKTAYARAGGYRNADSFMAVIGGTAGPVHEST